MAQWRLWKDRAEQHTVFDALFAAAEVICVKVGSSLLVDIEHNTMRDNWMITLATDLAKLLQQNKRVIIVASGAVATARTRALPDDETLVRKQALAAVGQPHLMMHFARAFSTQGLEVAQVLFNPRDTEDRSRYLDVRNTLDQLMDIGIVPIINENDSLSTKALRYGDNDRLSARVAGMVNADILLMFSDVDGLYDATPEGNEQACLIGEIAEITPAVMALAGGEGSRLGTGGMRTKLLAAEMCLASNCHMILTSGVSDFPLQTLRDTGRASLFRASSGSPLQARKRWLAGTLTPMGVVQIDHGAMLALRQGKSLLAAGICGVSGKFSRGEAINIQHDQHIVALGISNYHHTEIAQICGKKSSEIHHILGYLRENTVIHRNNLVLR